MRMKKTSLNSYDTWLIMVSDVTNKVKSTHTNQNYDRLQKTESAMIAQFLLQLIEISITLITIF